MDTISTFAKILSSDGSLAHAGTRRLAVFCWAAVGSCKLSEPCRGDRLRLLGRLSMPVERSVRSTIGWTS